MKRINFKTPYVDIKQLNKMLLRLMKLHFKTPYVDIKQRSFSINFDVNIYFKTPYVDIKLNFCNIVIESIHISKHHMLILNNAGKTVNDKNRLISKHHMLILNTEDTVIVRYNNRFQNTIC